MKPLFEARELLRNCLRQIAVHGPSETACDLADEALADLTIGKVAAAVTASGRYHAAASAAFLTAHEHGVFHAG
jgi:hypothetical protein